MLLNNIPEFSDLIYQLTNCNWISKIIFSRLTSKVVEQIQPPMAKTAYTSKKTNTIL